MKIGTLSAPRRKVNRRDRTSSCMFWVTAFGAVLALSGCEKTRPRNASSDRPATAQGADPSPSAVDSFRRPAVLLSALRISEGQAVAEVGAGGGYLTQHLAKAVGPSGKVVATDIDPSAIAALRARLRSLPQVTARLCEKEESGLEQASYDAIVLCDVVHLLPQPDRYLSALFPSLRPGGHLYVCGRLDRRPVVDQAAAKAGLAIREIPADLPAQFVVEVLR